MKPATWADVRIAGARSRVRSKLRGALGGCLPADFFTAEEREQLQYMQREGQIRFDTTEGLGVWVLNDRVS